MAAKYPRTRMRRNRSDDFVRRLVREHDITTNDLIYPIFIVEGSGVRQPIDSMPGIEYLSIDELANEVCLLHTLNIPAIALFPRIDPSLKDATGSESINPNGLVPRAINVVKDTCPDLGVITDAALDPYTSHGHDGVLNESGYVLNDQTIEILIEQARVCVQAGSDVIAPSDMMDGRIGAIREMLENNGYVNTKIMAYSAKYASAYYGPFRDAVGSASPLGTGSKGNVPNGCRK